MDNNNLKEKNFEEDIERWLLDEGGYERGFQMTYNKAEAIDFCRCARTEKSVDRPKS